MPTQPEDQPRPEAIKRLLAQTPVIRNACDLDLLGFLHRHPRALLTSEQVAGFVGYSLKQVAEALEAFIAAGLLARLFHTRICILARVAQITYGNWPRSVEIG